MDTGKSAIGLDGNLAAAIGYPIWIVAVICFFMDKENRFVKFHAMQSIMLWIAGAVVGVALWIIGIIVFIGGIAASAATNSGALGGVVGSLLGLIWLVFVLAFIAAIIFAAVKAYGGNDFKLPLVGNMAEKFANK